MAQPAEFTEIDDKASYVYDTIKLTPEAKKALAVFKANNGCKTFSEAVLLAVTPR